MFHFKSILAISFLVQLATAGPMLLQPRQSKEQPKALTGDTTKYSDAAQWANSVYCNHTFGDVIHGATVYGAFGDGGDTAPYAFVAYHPKQDKIIVAHQGTDITKLEAVYADFDIKPSFPETRIQECNLDPLSLVHTGFQRMWDVTADGVYSIVKLLLEIHPEASLLLTGHSLGAAISVFELIFLRCHLPEKTKVDAIVFGLPRTGNMAFAESVPYFQHVVNGGDIIPHLPERAANRTVGNLGFWQPGEQVWQKIANDPSSAVICPGLENENCSNSLSHDKIVAADHLGNNFGVRMLGTMNCVPNA